MSSMVVAAMTYNQPQLIEDLYREVPTLLVVDNGSTVPIPYTKIRIPENKYFAGGWNEAMKEINADWVFMLNDDITGLTAQMADALLDIALQEGLDAISPTFNSPHSHMHPRAHRLFRQVYHLDWIAVLIRKRAWDDVGGFDAARFPGYGSDLDLSYRLREKGYRLAVSDQHTIHHIGGKAAIEGGTQIVQGNVAAMNASFQLKYAVSGWEEFVWKYLS